MATYTINLTETEDLALQFVAHSADEWIQNAVRERVRLAINEIVDISVQAFLAAGQPTPGTREEIVAAAYANGWVKTAAVRAAEAQARVAALEAR